MSRKRWWIVALCGLGLGLAAGAARSPGADPETSKADRDKAEREAATRRDVKALAAKIDEFVAAKWAEAKVAPSSVADDSEFLRRAHLDIVGKIPPAAETRAFLDDKDVDKREKLVEKLLKSPGFANHFTNVWKALLLPEEANDFTLRYYTGFSFDVWLRNRLSRDARYDKIARELVTVQIGDGPRSQVYPYNNDNGAPTPVAFYLAKKGKPENLAASTSRLFLGVRIECAQCHDHPFARWKREEFWGYASFFGGVERQGEEDFSPIRELTDRRELSIPGTDRVVQAGFLDGTEPQWKTKTNPRETLAEWLTAPGNPFFAKAGANRIWAQMFGTGLVDPVDDMSDDNPPSHPELLDELAKQFAAHQFDIRFLVRAIAASRAYQLTSALPPGASAGPDDARLFAHKALKGLSSEQLFDSVAEATGIGNNARDFNPFDNNSPRAMFLEKFKNTDDKPTEHQTSILHALSLMNGQMINDATMLDKGATIGSLADAPFLDTAGKVEALYLSTLSRRPRADELEKMTEYVERGGPARNAKKALADVFWALLNSSEFLLNH